MNPAMIIAPVSSPNAPGLDFWFVVLSRFSSPVRRAGTSPDLQVVTVESAIPTVSRGSALSRALATIPDQKWDMVMGFPLARARIAQFLGLWCEKLLRKDQQQQAFRFCF
jgi:hypothetical protein